MGDLVVGGQRVSTGKRFGALLAAAAEAEKEAWETLGPFLAARAGRDVAGTTDTTAVLGEEGS